jgi:septum site-determining protein MinC
MPAQTATLEASFELKFGQVGIANLRLRDADPAALANELARKVQAAPQLFARAPLVIDLSRLPQLPDRENVAALLDAVRTAGMLPVGLSYGTAENEELAKTLDLPLFAKFRAAYDSSAKKNSETSDVVPTPTQSSSAGMHHVKPVRSGQQIYAKARDLIVNATVGNGAEVIADGSIHVYGRLSGRALAGAQGDASARIYCLDFHAELISIAGRYRVFEDMPAELRGKAVQARLDGERLVLDAL